MTASSPTSTAGPTWSAAGTWALPPMGGSWRNCLAVNLLPLDDLRQVMKHLALLPPDLTVKDRATQAAGLLQACARENGVELKLRRKPKGPAETGVSF